jgi:hypothetical protein
MVEFNANLVMSLQEEGKCSETQAQGRGNVTQTHKERKTM